MHSLIVFKTGWGIANTKKTKENNNAGNAVARHTKSITSVNCHRYHVSRRYTLCELLYSVFKCVLFQLRVDVDEVKFGTRYRASKLSQETHANMLL